MDFFAERVEDHSFFIAFSAHKWSESEKNYASCEDSWTWNFENRLGPLGEFQVSTDLL